MFKKKLFSNNSLRPFKLSRTKIDLFIECRRCFFRSKIWNKKTSWNSIGLSNRIVDDFKKELNICRVKKNIHSKSERIKQKSYTYESQQTRGMEKFFQKGFFSR